MKIYIFFSLTALLLLSCVSQVPSSKLSSNQIDELIVQIADNTILYLPETDKSNLAVYYFTVDGKESSISDYLINGLTTEIANKVSPGYTVVSRKGLDRIMDEYSFQLTDLVSEETQVDIGELLGADTIITGFITSLPDRDNINIQIIDVHSGAVMGGFSLDYQLAGDFGRDYSSETIVVERKYEETSGVATKTIIFENFNNVISDINPSHYEEYWGEQILQASGETGIDSDGFAYLDFSGEFQSTDYINDWIDSDITYYFDLPLKQKIEDSEGIYVKIKPQDFSRVYLFVKQEENDNVTVFGSPIDLIPRVWNELNIPFENLIYIDGEKNLNYQKEITFTVGIPYIENVHQFHFNGDKEFKSRLSIDEIGFYTLKNKVKENVISTFEDEINKALVSYYVDGSFMYVDYKADDSGILKRNKGIETQNITVEIQENGPVGRYLSFKGDFTVNDQINEFIDNWGEILLVLDLKTSIRFDEEKNYSFLINSDTVEQGIIGLNDFQSGNIYESYFNLNKSWTRISFLLKDKLIDNEDHDMAGNSPSSIRFVWTIPEKTLRDAAETGNLQFTINLDELILEEKK